MLRDAADRKDESGGPTWAQEAPAWRVIDRALRSIAKRHAGLDAEELRWIREAEAAQIWRPLGMVNLLDYLERTFGYTPRVAQERIRVARALDQLPLLTDALATGGLPFSALRELTRVVTPATEAAWVDEARGKNLRQIEEMVAGHRPGDNPDDPPDPEVRTHVLRFEVSGPTKALLRQVRVEIEDELGTRLDDDAFLATLARRAVEAPSGEAPSGRATFQIGVTQCRSCKQAWQDGGGTTVAIDADAFGRAACHAQHLGAVDAAVPERATRISRPRSRAWCTCAITAGAASRAVAPHVRWSYITSSTASTAARTSRPTSS